jgi:hypothetical protein
VNVITDHHSCTGSVETLGFTLNAPSCFSFFFLFLYGSIFFLAEVRRKIFFKNFSFRGKGGLITFGFSPNIPLQESLIAYKIPSFAGAKMSARAVLSRTFDLIRKIFTHVPSDLAFFPKKKMKKAAQRTKTLN